MRYFVRFARTCVLVHTPTVVCVYCVCMRVCVLCFASVVCAAWSIVQYGLSPFTAGEWRQSSRRCCCSMRSPTPGGRWTKAPCAWRPMSSGWLPCDHPAVGRQPQNPPPPTGNRDLRPCPLLSAWKVAVQGFEVVISQWGCTRINTRGGPLLGTRGWVRLVGAVSKANLPQECTLCLLWLCCCCCCCCSAASATANQNRCNG